MALVVGTNSWASVAEADAYLADRVSANIWFDLSDTAAPGEESKEAFLVTAFWWLYGYAGLDMPLVSSDSNVKNAQIEAALFLLKYYDEYEKRDALMSAGVEEFNRSKWSEKLNAENKIPAHIKGLLITYTTDNMVVQLYPEDYVDEWT